MRDTIIANGFMILVATIIIGLTISERLTEGAANGFLVWMAMLSTIAVVVGISNIRHESKIRR